MLTLIKNWRKCLLKYHNICVLLMDQNSEAIDYMPHELLKAFGFQDPSINVFFNFKPYNLFLI